jgi:CRP-like cAMP-binding protein
MPESEYGELARYLQSYDLVTGDVLYDSGARPEYVYFPKLGVVSIVTTMEDGSGVEAVTIGREGLIGLAVLHGDGISSQRCVVQVPDGSLRCTTRQFHELLPQMPALHRLLTRFGACLFDQASQGAACNALHPVMERCARWLLLTHDRMRQQSFHLTHEYLSEMLGVRRPSVSIAANTLGRAGLISYRRGVVEVLDRDGLEDASCECYVVIREIIDRLLPEPG